MKVAFTAKEYARLLELVYMGLRVADAGSEESDALPERYADVAQKVFAYAEVLGCSDLVEIDAEGWASPAQKLEEGPALARLEKFVDESFWTELATRLADRDLRAELRAAELSATLTEEELAKLAQYEDGYWREFSASGVDHLHVLRGGQG